MYFLCSYLFFFSFLILDHHHHHHHQALNPNLLRTLSSIYLLLLFSLLSVNFMCSLIYVNVNIPNTMFGKEKLRKQKENLKSISLI